MKKIIKTFLFFSMMIVSFVGVSANTDVEVVNAALTKDYSNLTFDAGDTSVPSGYFYNGNSNGVPIIESDISGDGYNFASGILITKGGESKFPFQASKPTDSKRYMGFTLYENVELEIGLFTEGSSDDFYIADTSEIIHTETFTKKVEHHFVYNFKNIGSNGSDFYFGGTSNFYVTYIHWGESVPKAYFDANGGTFSDGSSRTSSIKEGASIGDPVSAVEEPTHSEGYKFLGWATSKDSTTPVNSYTIGSTYYAIWSTEKEATSININYGTLTLNEGEDAWLDCTALPSSASVGNLTWSSSDENVATVDKDGYVTAVAPGTAVITVTNGTLSDTCNVHVVATEKYTVTFQMEGYNDKQVTVYSGGKVTVPGQFQSIKGYDVEWTYNGVVFDVKNDVVKQDMTLVGRLVPNGYATGAKIQRYDDNGNKVNIAIDEVVNIKDCNKLTFELYRDDGEAITVTEPHYWSSNDISTITIDQDGNLNALKMGRVQITLALYDTNNDNRFTTTIVVINSEKTDENGNVINTDILIVAQKGYFEATGDNELGARFIGVIPEEYLPYVYSAKMLITARLDSDGDGEYEIDQPYEVDIKTFYKTIDYQSKTPSSGALKKAWSEEGKLGAAVTIVKIPYYGFKGGILSAKLTITDKDSRLDFYAYAELCF